jgi:3-hydroxy acid dehydrogenase/malonic semialdehyde reductase
MSAISIMIYIQYKGNNMFDLKGKVVFITGASSGIGHACAKQFAGLGAKLIITARREDRLKDLARELKETYNTELLLQTLDVTDKKQVEHCITNLDADWSEIAVLVNNAGLGLDTLPLQEGIPDHWDTMIDTNIKGLLYVTHEVIQGMVTRNSGHIINISSIAGHEHYPNGNVYCATKHAVRSLSKNLRLDLLGTALRVSDVAPGAVETEFSIVRWKDKEKAEKFYQDFTPLVAADIADAVVYCATRAQHVNIAEIVVYPTDQASANHIARKE